MDEKADCKPSFLRANGALSACKKPKYDSSWVASRNGTLWTLARFAKDLRIRFFSVNE
jgi:hypothetical protein